MRFIIIIYLLFCTFISGSGAFDHGTSTGKGKFEIDITWNPMNYFKHGQSYLVFGYGITNRFDLHAYYCDHDNYNKGVKSYYYGIFYQFFETDYLDLSTAIGSRKMMDLKYPHLFFPQLLYNFKLYNNFSLGGSIVNITTHSKPLSNSNNWGAIDITFFIPFTRYLSKKGKIEEIKLGIGLFKTGIGLDTIESKKFLPTYSIDIKFKSIYNL